MDDFDHSLCSFRIPEFSSREDEIEWMRSLTSSQGFEIMRLMNIARWCEEAVNAPMDRTKLVAMSMQEFNEMKEREDKEEQAWRATRLER